jgi:His/Glu/Gln/Arg/opine family amino acid ABC transporter permease subunit
MMDASFAALLAGKLLEGLKMTLLLLAVCGVAGNLLAMPLALARVSSNRFLRAPAYCFILVMRGTPVLVQLYIIYYGLGEVLSQMPAIRESMFWPYLRSGFWYAALALTLNTSAYCGEILRGAITNVPAGQVEAAKSLGMRRLPIMFLVVVPQAIRAALPSLAGQNILLLKATSLASTITIFEVMAAANQVRSETFRVYESLFGAAIVYVILTLGLTAVFSFIEVRMDRPYRR